MVQVARFSYAVESVHFPSELWQSKDNHFLTIRACGIGGIIEVPVQRLACTREQRAGVFRVVIYRHNQIECLVSKLFP